MIAPWAQMWIAQASASDEGGWIIGGIFSSRAKAEAFGWKEWPHGGWQVSRWWMNDVRAPYSPEYVSNTESRPE